MAKKEGITRKRKTAQEYINGESIMAVTFDGRELRDLIKEKVIGIADFPAEVHDKVCVKLGIEPRIMGRVSADEKIQAKYGFNKQELIRRAIAGEDIEPVKED